MPDMALRFQTCSTMPGYTRLNAMKNKKYNVRKNKAPQTILCIKSSLQSIAAKAPNAIAMLAEYIGLISVMKYIKTNAKDGDMSASK